jgi:hypothetical protein
MAVSMVTTGSIQRILISWTRIKRIVLINFPANTSQYSARAFLAVVNLALTLFLGRYASELIDTMAASGPTVGHLMLTQAKGGMIAYVGGGGGGGGLTRCYTDRAYLFFRFVQHKYYFSDERYEDVRWMGR